MTYKDNKHLWATASDEAGTVAVLPLSESRIMFDAAHAGHLPANLPTGEHGSTVLDLGGGFSVRAHGFLVARPGGWEVEVHYTGLTGYTGNVTPKRAARAYEVLRRIVTDWAIEHPNELHEAEMIARNNAAIRLREQIEARESELAILRENLSRCEDYPRPYQTYPLEG